MCKWSEVSALIKKRYEALPLHTHMHTCPDCQDEWWHTVKEGSCDSPEHHLARCAECNV